VGSNGSPNTDTKIRLQLFHPVKSNRRRQLSNPNVPEVYHWWTSPSRLPYPSTLYVTVKGIKPPKDIDAAGRSMFAVQEVCVSSIVKTTACNFVLDSSGLKITAGQRGQWPAKNASWPVTFLPSPVILTGHISCLPMWFLTSWIKTWNYDVSKQVSNSLFHC
jgi:hypothetical protein